MEDGIAQYALALADGIEAALPGWVFGSVQRIMVAWSGSLPDEVAEAARAAGEEAVVDVGGSVRRLLLADIDSQETTPLALVRSAVVYPTRVLRRFGVPEVERDRFEASRFPDDVYGLAPATFADLDPSLGDAGIAWGAAKAFEHKRRHGR